MLHYILQTIAFQLFFLMVYDLFLKRETFFNWNRFYLLFTPIAAFVLPLIKIEAFKNVLPQDYIVQLPAVILNSDSSAVETQFSPTIFLKNSGSFWSLEFILYVGISVSTFIFLFKMYGLLKTINISKNNSVNGLTIITLKNSSAAFSFFNYVFLGDAIKPENYQTILAHECVHTHQKHSADLLFFELLRILFWFNPLVYMYQNRMVTLHEYIADALVVKQQDKATYYQNLLSQVFDVNHISFINPFFRQSLIKKRIIMLTKTKSKQIHLVKYALIIPLIAVMLFYTSNTGYSQSIESAPTEHQNSTEKEMILNSEAAKIHVTGTDENSVRTTVAVGTKTKVNTIDQDDLVEVPFTVVDNIPTYPECEDLLRAEQIKCVSSKISTFIAQNFNTDLAKKEGLTGNQRINVIFKIDREGNITSIATRSKSEVLANEAKRVIALLPKMIPGEHKGEKVVVPYSLPIELNVS